MSASATQGGHKKPQDENIMACPTSLSGHKNNIARIRPMSRRQCSFCENKNDVDYDRYRHFTQFIR